MPDVLKPNEPRSPLRHRVPVGVAMLGGLVGLLAMTGSTAAAQPVRTEHSEATLFTDHAVVRPGQSFTLALRLRHDAGWHSYWINPGDSGLATKMLWSLPEGWRAGAIRWPTPIRFEVDGLANYGYADEVLLPVPVDVPADAEPGSTVVLAGEARWLACADICVPEKARLELTLRVGESPATSDESARIAQQIAALPRAVAIDAGTVRRTGDELVLSLLGLPAWLEPGTQYAVYPRSASWLQDAPMKLHVEEDGSAVLRALPNAFATGWPERPTLLLRPDDAHRPAVELTLELDPPTPEGVSP